MSVAGIDLAFKTNSSGLAIAEPAERKRIVSVHEWQPGATALVPSIVCRDIARRCVEAGVTIAGADGHYIETLREALDVVGIQLVDAPAVPSVAWLLLQEDVLDGVADIVAHERLRVQLEAVKFSYESGGVVKVHQDLASDGSHGDLASAVAVAWWLMHETADTGRMLGGRVSRAGSQQPTVAELIARTGRRGRVL